VAKFSFSNINNRFWIAFSTVISIGLIFGIYFFYYVKNKEAEFVKEGYRILRRVGDNIGEKKINFEKLSLNTAVEQPPFAKEEDTHTTEKWMDFAAKPQSPLPPKTKDWPDSYTSAEIDTPKNFIATRDFMQPLLRMDFFDDYFIRGKKIWYSTAEIDLKIYPDSLRKGSIQTPDQIKDLTISGAPYKVFIHQIHLQNEKWIICGLISLSHYQNQIHRVDPFYTMIAALMLLGLLVGMPLIKIFLLNKIERLYTFDIVAAGCSLILGVMILTIIFFSVFFSRFHSEEKAVTDNLQKLSISIREKFKKDLKEATKALGNYDKIVSINANSVRWSLQPSLPHNIFWMNDKGVVQLDFSIFRDNVTNVDLSDRLYFRAIKEHGKLLNIDGNSIFLQSIVSWVNQGLYEGVVSIPSINEKYPVAAHASSLPSVMNTILAPGYGFAVLDEKANVLFHSDQRKNLQENFAEEIQRNDKFKSALYSRTPLCKEKVIYHGHSNEIYLQPIEDLPLFLVTFYDDDYINEPLIQTLTISTELSILYILLLGVFLTLFMICTYERSALRTFQFPLNWLRPCKMSIRSYQVLILIQAAAFFGMLVTFGVFKDQKQYEDSIVGLLLAIPVIIFLVSWRKLGNHHHPDKSWTNGEMPVFTYKVFIAMWLVLIAVLPVYILFSYTWNHEKELVARFELLTTAKEILNRDQVLDSVSKNLILSDQDIDVDWSRTPSDSICMELAPNEKKANPGNPPKTDTKDGYGKTYCYADLFGRCSKLNYYLDKFQIEYSTKKISDDPLLEKDCLFGGFINDRSLRFTRLSTLISTEEDPALKGDELIWTSNKKNKEDSILLSLPNDKIFLREAIHSSFDPSFPSISFLILVPCLIMIGLWYALSFLMRNTHAWNFHQSRPVKDWFPIVVSEHAGKKVLNFQRLFLCTLPGSGIMEVVDEKLKEMGSDLDKFTHLDIIEWIAKDNINQAIESLPQTEVLLIRNFEFNPESHATWTKKLEILEVVVRKFKCPIVIISEVGFSQIIEFYDQLKMKCGQLTTPDRDSIKSVYHEQQTRWKSVLGRFINLLMPTESVRLKIAWATGDLQKIVSSELSYGNYLRTLEPILEELYKRPAHVSTDHRLEEDIIVKIESIAAPYYHNLWSAFSKEEKFLIYDLAQDNFANLKNKEVMKDLFQKGILRFNECGSLLLMNRSFTNFVLQAVKGDEELTMENELKNKGTWNSLKFMLLFIVLGLIVFLALGQQAIVTNMNATLGAVGAIAALFIKLSGILDSKKTSSN
jgi:hypothetical protein